MLKHLMNVIPETIHSLIRVFSGLRRFMDEERTPKFLETNSTDI